MDRRHLSLAREADVRYDQLIPADDRGHAAGRVPGATIRSKSANGCGRCVDRVRPQKRLAFDSRQTFSHDEMELYWQLARKVVPTLVSPEGIDAGVAVRRGHGHSAGSAARLPGRNAKRAQAAPGDGLALCAMPATASCTCGRFSIWAIRTTCERWQRLAADLYEAVFDVGGTISGEHGDGLSRTPFIERQYGELYPLFAARSSGSSTPMNVLNPGKIVGGEPPDRHFDPCANRRCQRCRILAAGRAPRPRGRRKRTSRAADELAPADPLARGASRTIATPPHWSNCSSIGLPPRWTTWREAATAAAPAARRTPACGCARSFRFAPAEEARRGPRPT